MATSDKQLLARLLYKLWRNKCFRKGHMLEEHLISAVPKSERGAARDVLKEAIKLELIVTYGPTNQGAAYQLNMEKLEEIENIIKEEMPERVI